jgi:hypothetical protein
MSTSVVANRINERKRYAVEDFKELFPDVVLVRGCKPSTSTKTGLLLPGAGAVGEMPKEEVDYPLRACFAFEVVKMPGEMSKGNPLAVNVGDVVMCRNVLVDPLLGNEFGITDLYMGVVAVLERAA